MVFVVDDDDVTMIDYVQSDLPVVSLEHSGGGMGPPMNAAALKYAPDFDIVGFIGDDHKFRTPGWDERIEEALIPGGFAYGNDLARDDIPTEVFISSEIVLELGWFCLPGAYHLYLDNTWADLGNMTNSLYYLPDVIIEHQHPIYGKAETDEGYKRVNAPAIYSHDGTLYGQWIDSGQRDLDLLKVRKHLR